MKTNNFMNLNGILGRFILVLKLPFYGVLYFVWLALMIIPLIGYIFRGKNSIIAKAFEETFKEKVNPMLYEALIKKGWKYENKK